MTRSHPTAKAPNEGLGRMLYLGSLRGLWTLEDLDHPSPERRRLQSAIDRQALQRNEGPHKLRNLAREWMAANPRDADALLRQSLEREKLDHLPNGPQIVAAALGLSSGHN